MVLAEKKKLEAAEEISALKQKVQDLNHKLMVSVYKDVQ